MAETINENKDWITMQRLSPEEEISVRRQLQNGDTLQRIKEGAWLKRVFDEDEIRWAEKEAKNDDDPNGRMRSTIFHRKVDGIWWYPLWRKEAAEAEADFLATREKEAVEKEAVEKEAAEKKTVFEGGLCLKEDCV
jgi:hypothetical protein